MGWGVMADRRTSVASVTIDTALRAKGMIVALGDDVLAELHQPRQNLILEKATRPTDALQKYSDQAALMYE